MKKSVIWMVIVAVFSFTKAFASEEVGVDAIEKDNSVVTLTSQFLTHYVDDNGAKIGQGSFIKTGLLVALPKGFYLEALNFSPLKKHSDGRENDLSIGIETEVGPFVFDVGGSYIDIDKMVKVDESDLWLIYASGKKEFELTGNQKLSPFIKGYVYLPVKGSDVDKKGFQIFAGATHDIAFAKNVDFSHQLMFVYDDGAFGYQNAKLIDYSGELKVKIVDHVALILGGRVISPLTQVSDGRTMETIGSAGLAFSF